MSTRVMTWNCLGIADNARRIKLDAYMKKNNIDIAFLQEGSEDYDNAVRESISTSSSMTLLAAEGKKTEVAMYSLGGTKVESSVFGTYQVVSPADGVSRSAYYNTKINSGALSFTGLTEPDYCSALKDWILDPADLQKHALRERGSGSKIEFNHTGRPGFKNWGTRNVKDMVHANITRKIQHRVNMLGHRRPKMIKVANKSIYFWHAPLGSTTTLANIDMKKYDAVKACGSGGELAVAASAVFSKYLDCKKQFPAGTILLGDLNINSEAVKQIYNLNGVGSVLSSNDGWCHAIAGPATPLQLISNQLDQDALWYSDHAPIVFDF